MAAEKLQSRSEISEQYRWKLEDIYSSDQQWEADLAKLKEDLTEISGFRGKLNTGEQLLECLKRADQLSMVMEKVAAYAYMRKDEDNANSKYQEFADKAMSVSVSMQSTFAFIEPEILAKPGETVRDWVNQVKGLNIYRHYLDNLLRMKPHTLPTEQEELLAQAGEIAQAPASIFRMFNNADLKFPTIRDEHDNQVELTHGRYVHFLESKDRRVRKDAFEAMYGTYGQWKNTLATTFTASVKKAHFFSKIRKYHSTLEMALDSDNVKPEVYHNLISTVHEQLPAFYRYMKLRKDLLELDELHMYDIYVPMVKDVEMKIERDQAVEMVQEGLRPLGETYCQDLAKGFTDRWIDWYETKGKTSGAYSWGAYGVHPFVLMNYQENIDNTFTLAHEMGHAMHSFYSSKHQEYINADYTIFVAEVASTVNECLLMSDLLEKTQDKQQRMYLLNHYLEQFRGTVFRQTMFAEFEMMIHDKIGKGQPQTADSLSQAYRELNEGYFGSEVTIDPEIALEWARIPHFYRPFYVYKYATGFSAAVALANQIKEQGQVEPYLKFLQSGGSDYPLNLLKEAGVDMTTPEPIVAALKVFSSLVDELAQLATE